jgi:hypothetical protein
LKILRNKYIKIAVRVTAAVIAHVGKLKFSMVEPIQFGSKLKQLSLVGFHFPFSKAILVVMLI